MRSHTLTALSDPERLRYSLQSMLDRVSGPLRQRLEARLAEVERQVRQRKGTKRVEHHQRTEDAAHATRHAPRSSAQHSRSVSKWQQAFPGQAEAAQAVQRRHARASRPEQARDIRPTVRTTARSSGDSRSNPTRPRTAGARGDASVANRDTPRATRAGILQSDAGAGSSTFRDLLACTRCRPHWATESETRYACPKGHILEVHQARQVGEGWEVK